MAFSIRACHRSSSTLLRNVFSHGILRQHCPSETTDIAALHASKFTRIRRDTRYLQTSMSRPHSSRDTPSETPPTDFNDLDVLGGVPAPSTSVDVCMYDGFGLNSGITITGGNGALLVSGEAFRWRPWEAKQSMQLLNREGQFELPPAAFGLIDVLWPRPGTLAISLFCNSICEFCPLSPNYCTRK